MATNPLQNYFRQPKVYIKLPSGGAYNKLGSITGDVTNMPVYGMTGMDEVIMKTPDALLSGEASVKVIQSCCPNVKDAWELSVLDTDLIFAAIRIATYGNQIEVSSTCKECGADNEHELDLSKIIEHYNNFKFNNTVTINGLSIKIRPLNYRESTEMSKRNYVLQRQLKQSETLGEDEQREVINRLYDDVSKLQSEIFYKCVDAIETPTEVVTEPAYIKEFLDNCDRDVFDSIKALFDKNKDSLVAPPFVASCDSCGAENPVFFALDESNFFAHA